jgi:hypothetical protein
VLNQRQANKYTSPDEVVTKTPAAGLIITLNDAKNMVVSRNSFDDDYITSLIKGLTVMLEERINLSLMQKTLQASYRNVVFGIELQFCPLVSITNVKVNGVVVSSDTYEVKGLLRKFLFFNTALTYDEVEIEYIVGYSVVPEQYLVAIRQEITFQFQNRGQDQKNELTYPVIERFETYQAKPTINNFAMYSI